MARKSAAPVLAPAVLPGAYDVHPGVAMVQKFVADLPEKTGKTLEEWGELVDAQGFDTAAEKRSFLKTKHGFGTNAAAWIVEYTDDNPTWDADPESYLACAAEFVDDMYSGGKEHLRPVFERLLEVGRALGEDVKVCPCKTMVPLYRGRVFAEIKPSTKTRIDLSLALTLDVPEQGKLKRNEQRIKKGDRLTHLIALEKLDDVTPEVKRWLKAAYVAVGA